MFDAPAAPPSTLREDRAAFIVDVLARLHTYALRSYIAEHGSALDFLYGAMPMPDEDLLERDVNLLTLHFLPYGALATFWNDLATATATAGVTDAMQLTGKPGRGIVARRRQAYVMTAQTFWLSYWNTYKIV
jgi:hypothetical protein